MSQSSPVLPSQGNWVNVSWGEEAGEEVVVPGGDLSAEVEGIFAGGFLDQVQGDVLDGREVGRGVVGAQPLAERKFVARFRRSDISLRKRRRPSTRRQAVLPTSPRRSA